MTTRPEAILEEVRVAYRRMVEYHDMGRVQSSTTGKIVTFETHFVRDHLFEFAFSSNPKGADLVPIARLKSSEDKLEFWTVFGEKVPAPESLRMAVAALTGISLGAAHTVSCLLLEEVGGVYPTDLRNPQWLPSRTIGGAVCNEIRGAHGSGKREESLLLEQSTGLIRARITHGEFEDLATYEVGQAL